MSPVQLYTSMYQEQFSSPGRVRRTELRPTSAHRRNNPQPRADFLFPLSLKSRSQLPLVVDRGRTPLPPIGPPHSPNINSTVDKSTQLNMAPVGVHRYLPSVHRVPHNTTTTTTTTTVYHQNGTAGNKATRRGSDSGLQGRPHTTGPRPRTLSHSSLDYSGCCSCFHLVKPFQAGHYTIHPEFTSEHIHQGQD